MSSLLCYACLWCAWILLLPACGSERIVEPPCSAAQLQLVEIMADPVGADGGHEWLEVYNPGEREAVLDGLTVAHLSGTRRRAVTVETPHRLQPGGYWVLGNRGEAAPPVHYGYGTGLSLHNKQATVRLECAARLIDSVTYGAGSVPRPSRGASLQLAGGRWCASGALYDGENSGTPGGTNPPCAARDDAS